MKKHYEIKQSLEELYAPKNIRDNIKKTKNIAGKIGAASYFAATPLMIPGSAITASVAGRSIARSSASRLKGASEIAKLKNMKMTLKNRIEDIPRSLKKSGRVGYGETKRALFKKYEEIKDKYKMAIEKFRSASKAA